MKSLKILLTTKDLRNKILISLLLISVFRILSHIPVPFVDTSEIKILGSTDMFGLIDVFSGGALQNFTLMTTGVSAYISASIIIQMLSYFVPSVHRMIRSPGGDKKVKKITIVLGIICAFVASLVTTTAMNNVYGILTNDATWVYIVIALIHCGGTGLAVLLGETITEKGFGNGMSLLIAINVISSFPSIISALINSTGIPAIYMVTMIAFVLLTITFAIIAETSERRIPLFYPRAAVRGAVAKDSMFFPIKLNVSGVMPIILASYIIQLLSMIGRMDNVVGNFVERVLVIDSFRYICIFTVLIFLLTYFYSLISFDSREISDNMQKNGAIIPSVRQGKDTADYINDVRKGITTLSALYLSFIYFVPTAVLSLIDMNFLSATSAIILVGVSIETCKQLKVEIELRNFKTF